MKLLKRARAFLLSIERVTTRIQHIQEALGRIERRQLSRMALSDLKEAEYKVFSQWGEDGIVQHLIHSIAIENPVFVEFGVQDYTESNTRYLLINDNWRGLVLDGGEDNIAYIKKDPVYWRYNLKAECAFIDRDNVNLIIKECGLFGDIGLLSVDIDGNDYWVWKSIDVISPRIVICEYNSIFGPIERISVPYSPSFIRTESHYSNLYYGASISALTELAKSKGYSLVGGNKAGNNVFFVRADLMGQLTECSPQDAYVESNFRESRDRKGKFSYLSMDHRLKLIKDLPMINVDNMKEYKIKHIFGLPD